MTQTNKVMGRVLLVGTLVFALRSVANVISEDFERELGVGWSRLPEWSREKGLGRHSSAALIWTNRDPNCYAVEQLVIPNAKSGQSYEASFWVKPIELKGGKVACTIAWFAVSGEWIGGAGGPIVKWGDDRLQPDAAGWVRLVIRTPPLPSGVGRACVQLFMEKGATGRVAFDDLEVRCVESPAVAGMVANTVGGELAFGNACFSVRLHPCPATPSSERTAEFIYENTQGEAVRTSATRLTPERADFEIPVKMLRMGQQCVAFELKERGTRLLGRASCPVRRVQTIPRRRVEIDNLGRTLVDGKPFFPIGMYWSPNTLAREGALERFAKGPFNCLFNYENDMTPEMLDRYWSKGLMVVVNLGDVWGLDVPTAPRRLFATPKEIRTRTDETNWLNKVVSRCKDHPAVLAWCTGEEFERKYAAELRERYDLVRSMDREHPIWYLMMDTETTYDYINACDIIGSDPYPVRTGEPDKGSVAGAGSSAEFIQKAMFGYRGHWQVPQAFSWRWDPNADPNLRFPTENEMRNMVWQSIAAGANGVLLYSYGQILNKTTGAEQDECWRISATVGTEVRRLTDVLLLPPGPTVSVVPSGVRLRTWRRDDGSVFVLVCNYGHEARCGVVNVPGGWTACLSVFNGGLSLCPDGLQYRIPALGVSIVHLK